MDSPVQVSQEQPAPVTDYKLYNQNGGLRKSVSAIHGVPLTKNSMKVYTRYPISSRLIYNGTTILHFVLGGIGIFLGYHSLIGYILGSLYLVFSFTEMYVHMPLKVCPNCVYYKLDNSLCISGLNVISRRVAKEGSVNDFPNRARGIFCPNNLYIAALLIPVIAMIPALVLNFTFLVLVILIIVVGLLLFRFFVIFTKIACVHCLAKNVCPQARSMGLSTTE